MERPTRQQVETEPPGRRLDFWVAEFVMGWRRDEIGRWLARGTISIGGHLDGETVPYYSSTVACWEVVRQHQGDFELKRENRLWYAYFYTKKPDFGAKCWGTDTERVICQAALLYALEKPS